MRLVNEAMGGWPNHPFLNLSVGFPLDALTLASTLGLDNASARNAALELSLRISLLSGSREQGRLVSSGAIGGFGEGPRARSCCARGFRYRESGGKRPAQQALERSIVPYSSSQHTTSLSAGSSAPVLSGSASTRFGVTRKEP